MVSTSHSVTGKYKRHLSSGFGHLHPRGSQRAAMNDTKMNIRSTSVDDPSARANLGISYMCVCPQARPARGKLVVVMHKLQGCA